MNPASLQAMLNGDFPSAILAATPGGIERQEAAGQAKLVKSADRLPTAVNYPYDTTISEVSEKLGIQLGSIIDDVFIEATFPKGWHIKPTEHYMWSNLIDDRGRKRASIFYKAAFYDVSAHINFECRYDINGYATREDGGVKLRGCQVVDRSTEKVLWSSDFVGERDYDSQDKNSAEARKWLNENFPQRDDPFAYWNE
jgi:hypothetical protein